MIFVFLSLTSLSMTISRSIHVTGNSIISFLLWLSDIPLYIYIYICMYVCMYDIFFIHSSVDGHLGCFHVLAMINSAAVNTGVHVSFQIIVFSRSGIAGSYGSVYFLFGKLLFPSLFFYLSLLPDYSYRFFISPGF